MSSNLFTIYRAPKVAKAHLILKTFFNAATQENRRYLLCATVKVSTITYIDKAVHQDCMKCSICGDTSSGQTHASLPSVIALFSISDLLSPYKQQTQSATKHDQNYN